MANGDTGLSVFGVCICEQYKNLYFCCNYLISRKILKGLQFVKQNSPLHSLEKQEKRETFNKICCQ